MLLQVRNLVKIYRRGLLDRKVTTAVDGISFNVAEGEIVSLVGESGSGKSTTAHIILRMLLPTSGEVLFEGKNIAHLHGKELKQYWQKVHGVFQDPYAAFNPIFRADRILFQSLNLLEDKLVKYEAKKLISEIVLSVGLKPEHVLGRYPHQLSGGQLQRLMIARCFILKPKLIIADEPVSMVDPSVRVGILKLFEQLRNNYGTSVIFITHDIGLAYYTSTKIMVMYKGKIVEEGTPEEILNQPQHPYTKRLISDIPLLGKRWSDI